MIDLRMRYLARLHDGLPVIGEHFKLKVNNTNFVGMYYQDRHKFKSDLW